MTESAEVLRPTGDYASAIERITVGKQTANDLRLLHARERYEFIGRRFGAQSVDWIDLACGFGDNLFACAGMPAGARIAGVDCHRDVIESNRVDYPQITWTIRDAIQAVTLCNLPGYTRLITCMETLGHRGIADDVELLKHMKEMAGKGGYVIASIGRFEIGCRFQPHWYFARKYGAGGFAKLWRDAGFSKVEWFGQKYPANRRHIITEHAVYPCDDRFNGADFMIGVGIV